MASLFTGSLRLAASLLLLLAFLLTTLTTGGSAGVHALSPTPTSFSLVNGSSNGTAAVPSAQEVLLQRELNAFFLDHFSLGRCAEAITRNSSCPGAERPWAVHFTSFDQLKEMCTDLTTFSRCLRGRICKSCRKFPAVSYYCGLKATPSALAVCQTMVASAEEQPSLLGAHLLIFVTFAFFSLAFYLFTRLFL